MPCTFCWSCLIGGDGWPPKPRIFMMIESLWKKVCHSTCTKCVCWQFEVQQTYCYTQLVKLNHREVTIRWNCWYCDHLTTNALALALHVVLMPSDHDTTPGTPQIEDIKQCRIFRQEKKNGTWPAAANKPTQRYWPQFHYLAVIAQNWSMICEWQYSKVYLLHVIKWPITSVRMQAILTFWQHGDQGQSPAEQFMSHSFFNTWFCMKHMKHTWPTSFLQAKTLLFYPMDPYGTNLQKSWKLFPGKAPVGAGRWPIANATRRTFAWFWPLESSLGLMDKIKLNTWEVHPGNSTLNLKDFCLSGLQFQEKHVDFWSCAVWAGYSNSISGDH